MTLALKEAMDKVNKKLNGIVSSDDKDKREDIESDKKLTNIEVELEEIAMGVRDNVTKLIERGEKFDSLTKKSEELTSVSSGLKKRAK